MKLLHLEIENYGIFSDRHFDFGGPGLRLIYGANEAGKSTLLQLIRELLFGFPHRSPYVLPNHTGELAASATVEFSHGTRVKFRRRKGRLDTLLGEIESDGTPIDEAAFSNLLGGASAELYEHVFGFSLKELATGEKSLEHANLSEALYGSSLGGLANFQRVQQTVRQEHEALFSPRAAKRPINKLLAAIREQTQLIRDAAVKPRDYDELRAACTNHEAEVERLRGQLEQLQCEDRRLERLQAALRPWRQLAAARQQVDPIEVPAGFPLDAAELYRRTAAQLREVSDELDRLGKDLSEKTSRLNNLPLAPQLIAHEPEIRALYQDVGRIQRFRIDLPLRQQESQTIKEEVLGRITQLHPDWDLSHLKRFPSGLTHREPVQQMAQQHQQLQQMQTALQAQRPELDSQLAQTQKRLNELAGIEASPPLTNLVERSAQYRTDCAKQTELRQEIDTLISETESLLYRLSATLHHNSRNESRQRLGGDAKPPPNSGEFSYGENIELLPVPLPATVAKFRDRLRDGEQAVARAEQRVDELEAELTKQNQQLATLDAQEKVPDRHQLLAQRARREQAWQLIRQQYVEGLDVQAEVAAWLHSSEPADETLLIEYYQEQVLTADRLADERQAAAETVARREQLAATIDGQQQQVTAALDRLRQRQAEHEDLQRQWRDLWTDCQFQPQPPDVMLDWLRLHADALTKQQQLQARRSRLRQLEQAAHDFELQLAAALPDFQGSTETRLAEAHRQVKSAQEAAAQRKHFSAQLPQQQNKLQSLQQRLEETAVKQADWQRRWQTMLEQFGLPTTWDVQLATKILSGLADARQRYQEALSLDSRIKDIQAETDQFTDKVSNLCQQLVEGLCPKKGSDALKNKWSNLSPTASQGSDPFFGQTPGDATDPAPTESTWSHSAEDVRAGGRGARCQRASTESTWSHSAEDAALELNKRLETAKEAALAEKTLREELQNAHRSSAAKTQQRQRLEQQLQQLMTAAGSSTEQQFFQFAESARRQRELADEIAALSRAIKAHCGPDHEQQFLIELEQADEDSIASRRQRLAQEIHEIDAAYQHALQQAGIAREKLKELDGDSRATQLALELESRRAELAAAVDRWAPRVLADTLMSLAIQRFEREHQPAMLHDVTRLFSRMTLGRYIGIQRKLDEKGTLLVVQQDGQLKEPHQLSTGTREQLYLAIRLAYIQHYCRDSEPLPLVMDDVLVNFDDPRAQTTLEVLLDLSQHLQILVLTCHRATLHRIHHLHPTIPITYLTTDQSLDPAPSSPTPTRIDQPPPKPRPPKRKPTPTPDDTQRVLFPQP